MLSGVAWDLWGDWVIWGTEILLVGSGFPLEAYGNDNVGACSFDCPSTALCSAQEAKEAASGSGWVGYFEFGFRFVSFARVSGVALPFLGRGF